MSKVTMRVNEEVVLAVRKHALSVVAPLLLSFLLLIASFFFLFPLFALGAIGVALFCVLVFFSFAIGVRRWVLWRSTQLLVTTQRVVDVDRQGIFRWVISDVAYDTIADISYEVTGPLQVVCRAGNVLVTGLGNAHAIVAHFVPHPADVREAIMEQYAAARRGGNAQTAPSVTPATLDPEDARAVERYATNLQKRRAMRTYFDTEKKDA